MTSSTHILTKETKLSSLMVFASSAMNDVTDDFYFDTVTLREALSNTASQMSSLRSPTFSTSAGLHLSTATLSQKYSFRHTAKDSKPAMRETHSMPKKPAIRTSQQLFVSSNVIESVVTDDFYYSTVKLTTQFGSRVSTMILPSRPAIYTSGGLHRSTTTLPQRYSFRHTAKEYASTILTVLREKLSFTQNIRATKTSQQRFFSSNAIHSDVSDDFYLDTITLVTHFTSTASIASLPSPPSLSSSVGLDLDTTTLSHSYSFRHTAKQLTSITLGVSRKMLNFTQNNRVTKTSQQRISSSSVIGFEVSDNVCSNKVILSSYFTSAHAVSMVVLSSGHGLPISDGIFSRGYTSSFTNEMTERSRRETQKIQPTKTSQQLFSSDGTGSKGNLFMNLLTGKRDQNTVVHHLVLPSLCSYKRLKC